MKILVLGGQGFIGHNLCLKLKEEGHDVSIFNNFLDESKIIENCNYIIGDFFKIDEYEKDFNNVDIVYHLISTSNPGTSNDDIIKDIEGNVVNTIKVLNNCVKNNIKKVIFVSSGGTVYGIPEELPIKEEAKTDPICSYGITKLMIEKYLSLYNHLYNLDYSVIRLANPYGPFHVSNNQGLINVYLNKIINNESIEIWGNGEIGRDYIYIDDVTEALYLAMIKDQKDKIINIGSEKSTTINDIIKIISETLEIEPNIIYKESRNVDVPINTLDITRAREELSWYPKTDMKDGILKTYNSVKAEGLIKKQR